MSTILQSATLPPIDFIVANIINDLDEFEFPLIIVFDDFHFIENDGILELIVEPAALSAPTDPPCDHHAEDPNLPWSRCGHGIEWRTCAWSSCASPKKKRPVSYSAHWAICRRVDVERLASRTEGRCGLRLAALTVHESSTRTAGSVQAGMADDGLVMDYLAAEVLAQAGPDMRDLQRGTALCDRLCVEPVSLAG
ncbi:MAG: hypothetical protein R3A10_01485 [Caldilineaceae bacterium]